VKTDYLVEAALSNPALLWHIKVLQENPICSSYVLFNNAVLNSLFIAAVVFQIKQTGCNENK